MNHHVLFLFTFFLLRSVIFVRFISLIFFPCCCYHCHEQVKKWDKKRCNMCSLIKSMQKLGVHTYLKSKQTIHMDMRRIISHLYSIQTKQTFEITCARVRKRDCAMSECAFAHFRFQWITFLRHHYNAAALQASHVFFFSLNLNGRNIMKSATVYIVQLITLFARQKKKECDRFTVLSKAHMPCVLFFGAISPKFMTWTLLKKCGV